ncbi:MAG: Ig-like domain-containing protein [Gemmatimonadaceae bacterium]|nr:Ig-like domain-containing protein [Gemmatimonadaceae bacterium]
MPLVKPPRAVRASRVLLLALAAGVLLASCSDGPTGPAKVTPGSVVLTTGGATTLTSLGDSLTVTVRVLDTKGLPVSGLAFSYASSAPGVVVALGNGVFRAVGNGTADLIVTLDQPVRRRVNGVTELVRLADTIPVQVQQVPVQLTVAAFDSLFWSELVTRTATATLADARGNAVPGVLARPQWTSADTAVARVDSTGRVTAAGDGATTVTASYGALVRVLPVRVSARIPMSRCVQFSAAGTPGQACAPLTLTVRAASAP